MTPSAAQAAHPSHRSMLSYLPEFPWDSLADAEAVAKSYPEGIIDLSVGTPVDKVAPSIQQGLSDHADEPGYPKTVGTERLRHTIVDSMHRRYSVTGLEESEVLPVIGSKEAIGTLMFWLGIGKGHTIAIPGLSYPTYEVAARAVQADVIRADSPEELETAGVVPTVVFINTPANPHGKVLSTEQLSKWVDYARAHGTIIASDECYLGLGWSHDVSSRPSSSTTAPASILSDDVAHGDFTNLLAIHSLSKTSNLASYRAGFYAGDEQLISELAQVRRHCGMIVPGPIQDAMIVALNDDEQEAQQKQRYAARREVLAQALKDAGFEIEYSQAGLYLWVTQHVDCRETIDWLAKRGILAAPGEFYGSQGKEFVRLGLTASDEKISEAAQRLKG